MSQNMHTQVYDAFFTDAIHLDETPAGLVVTAIAGEDSAAVTLDAAGVAKLRKTLARYERKQKAGS